MYATLARDFDGDGHADILLGGNFSGVTPVLGRYDASYGLLLRGDGRGQFAAIDMHRSGVTVTGEVRDLKALRIRDAVAVAVARNDDAVMLLESRAANEMSPAVPSSPHSQARPR